MKKLYSFTLLSICGAMAFAQSNFQKAISIPFTNTPSPKSIIQCSDGGYLIGASSYNAGNYLIRTDANGTVTWTKSISLASGAALDEVGQNTSLGYYVLSEGSDSSFMSTRYYLTLLDAGGSILSTHQYSTNGYTYNSAKVRQTLDGGYMISESLYEKIGALKTDGNGVAQWNYSFTADTSISAKDPSFDCVVNSDGSMIFTGKRSSDIALVKSDASGNMMWTKTLSNGSSYYHTNSIAALPGGGYIIAGYEDYIAFLMKTDASGNITWYKTYTDPALGYFSFSHVAVLPNGNLFLEASDMWMMNYQTEYVLSDPNGNIIRSFTYGDGSNSMLTNPSFTLTSDGGVALTGYYTDNSSGLSGIGLIKMDGNFNSGCQQFNATAQNTTGAGAPYSQSVPFFRITENANGTALSTGTVSILATEADFCTLFSVQEHGSNIADVAVYPSPVANGEMLHVNIPGVVGKTVISVYDATGRLLDAKEQELVMNTPVDLQTTGYSKGVYLVRITDVNSNLIGETKFIVE
ncbi:MAG: T9SS type A sorting domain-containing protein [Bacteroidetes bacterium]|nr:T9SS type A sorting domain-containing protein [Bacteroidota bacterium]